MEKTEQQNLLEQYTARVQQRHRDDQQRVVGQRRDELGRDEDVETGRHAARLDTLRDGWMTAGRGRDSLLGMPTFLTNHFHTASQVIHLARLFPRDHWKFKM